MPGEKAANSSARLQKRKRSGDGGSNAGPGKKRQRCTSIVPAEVFKAGGVLPPEVADKVGKFAGGLLDHLEAVSRAALPGVVEKEAEAFRRLLRDSPAGASVVVHHFDRLGDLPGHEEMLDLLTQALPDAIVGYEESTAGYGTIWSIIGLGVADKARMCMDYVQRQARDGYRDCALDFTINQLPVCDRYAMRNQRLEVNDIISLYADMWKRALVNAGLPCKTAQWNARDGPIRANKRAAALLDGSRKGSVVCYGPYNGECHARDSLTDPTSVESMRWYAEFEVLFAARW
eukprot:TRINITY_DN24450_c0_g1_i1.p1 TRINITY_DN24450_c0_g1~~TRINITY_DN24450_c0_g1_i1.p1  ORF type:complete len:289 (+),score=53.35 TRINITY_DN24450_c0_g1_i1:84-950(+)